VSPRGLVDCHFQIMSFSGGLSDKCIALPEGWEARRDKKSGRIYFLNHVTKTTTWDDPRPLPYGWETKVDPRSGKKYFVNHNAKTTTWNDPRPPLNPDQIRQPKDKPVSAIAEKQASGIAISDMEVYEAILQMAAADKSISPAEEELLSRMRAKFGISDARHSEICTKLGITTWEFDLMKKRSESGVGGESATPGAGSGREECIICLDNPSDHVLLDCMHLCLCEPCAKELMATTKRCPKCRTEVKETRRVYY